MISLVDAIKDEHRWAEEQKKKIEERLSSLDVDTMDRLGILTEIIKLNRMKIRLLMSIDSYIGEEHPANIRVEDLRELLKLNIVILKHLFKYDEIIEIIIESAMDEVSKRLDQREELTYTA